MKNFDKFNPSMPAKQEAGISFKKVIPKTATYLLFLLFFPTLLSAQGISNDECTAATVITAFPFTDNINTTLATPNPEDPGLPCAGDGRGNTVWYSFTPSTTGFVQANTFGSNYNTALGVFTGSCSNLTEMFCNDEFGGRQSIIAWEAQAGVTYIIHVAEFDGGTGGGDLVFNLENFIPPTGPFVLEDFTLDDSPPSSEQATGIDSEPMQVEKDLNETIGKSLNKGFDAKIYDGNKSGKSDQRSGITLQSSGNGDGIPNGGEIINIIPTLRNDGNDALDVVAIIRSTSPFAAAMDDFSSFGTILSGQSSTADTDSWSVGINSDTPEGTIIDFDVEIRAFQGEPLTESFSITTGPSLLPITTQAEPGVLYGVTSERSSTPASLLTIDPITGVGNLIGPTGSPDFTSVSINSNREMFGVSRGPTNGLIRLDPTTGEARFIRGLLQLEAIAFDNNDTLFGMDFNGGLYTIDVETGTSTLIVNLGDRFSGLAFDPTENVLWSSTGGGAAKDPDAIYKIDPSTGNAIRVGTTGLGGATPDIAVDVAGNLFGVKGGGQSPDNQLISIDKSTGVGTVIGSTGFSGVSGLAFSPQAEVRKISVKPEIIDFLNVFVGDTNSRTVIVGNFGTEDLTVTAISDPGAPFSLDLSSLSTGGTFPLVIPPVGSETFKVTFSPTSSGDFDGTIMISSDDPDDPTKDVSITGFGLEPGVLLSLENVRIFEYFGNNDGIANAGERMNLPARLRNERADDALDVVATLSTENPAVTIFADQVSFGTVPFGVSNEAFGWRIGIAEDTAEGTVIDFEVTITASNAGPFTDSFSITLGPPIPPATGPFVLESFSLDDSPVSGGLSVDANERIVANEIAQPQLFADNWATNAIISDNPIDYNFQPSIEPMDSNPQLLSNSNKAGQDTSITVQSNGNGDGIPNGGEIIQILPTLRNDGNDAFEVTAAISSSSSFALIITNGTSSGTISSGESKNPPYPWIVGINSNTPEGTEIVFDVEVETFAGGPFMDSLSITTGPPLSLSEIALAEPGICYATTGRLDGGRLLTIDPTTGAGSLIGATGVNPGQFTTFNGVQGLAINSKGEIFASDVGGGLYRIDASTGAATLVTNTGTIRLQAIAFDAFDDLYGLDAPNNISSLYIIDPAAESANLIGSTKILNLTGMAFDPTTNVLFASTGGFAQDEIYTIDQTTGIATLVGTTGLGRSTPDLCFDASGNLFGVKGGGQSINNFISIDKTTGAGTVVGTTGFFSVSGLASRREPLQGGHISVIPNNINFANVEIDDTRSRGITISNIGMEDLTLSNISDPVTPFILNDLPSLPVVIPPKGSQTFGTKFTPADTNLATGTISFSSNDPDDPIVDLNLSGKGIVLNPAAPGVCYGTTAQFLVDDNKLIAIDPVTGTGELIGLTGTVGFTGLAINSKGEMFGSELVSGDLYQIDAATGGVVFFGSTGIRPLNGIAFDENDVLYGVQASSSEGSSSALFMIDSETGTSIQIGTNTGIDLLTGLTVDPTDGTLWASVGATGGNFPDAIVTIDKTTGVGTVVGTTGLGGRTPDLDFNADGNLFGIKERTSEDVFISIDKATGAGTVIGLTGFADVEGLAFGPGIRGDVNGDNIVNTDDILLVIDIILRRVPLTPELRAAADVSLDNKINIADVVAIVNIIRNSQFSVELASNNVSLKSAEVSLQSIQAGETGLNHLAIKTKLDGNAVAAVLAFNYDNTFLSIAEPVPNKTASGFNLISGSNDGEMIAVLFSQKGKLIESGESNLFSLPVTVKGNNNGNGITLETAQFVGVKGEIIEVVDGKVTSSPELPKAFGLSQNYPNPFNPSTTINFEIPETKQGEINVRLNIYNIRGQLVKTLMDEEKAAGYYSIYWDGRNETGQMLSSGIYYFQIEARDYKKTKKMVLLK